MNRIILLMLIVITASSAENELSYYVFSYSELPNSVSVKIEDSGGGRTIYVYNQSLFSIKDIVNLDLCTASVSSVRISLKEYQKENIVNTLVNVTHDGLCMSENQNSFTKISDTPFLYYFKENYIIYQSVNTVLLNEIPTKFPNIKIERYPR